MIGRASVWTALIAALALAIGDPARAQTLATAIVPSSAGDLRLETVAAGLSHPWGLAFLPGGRMLVTERPGRLRLVSAEGTVSAPLAGAPDVWASGQGGLLDVVADRDFAANSLIYLCHAERVANGGRTAVTRARLIETPVPHLGDQTVIFRQEGPPSSGNHYGCRIAQTPDRNLFVALGEHYTHRNEAQNLANHLGKIIRIAPDGAIPKDNPFAGRDNARAEIWSYGHRNPQSLAINPATGVLWEIEHGPRGGDEVNIIAPGKNYGWPVIGYGVDYSGAIIHEGTHKDGMEQPIKYWVPSIAPSGMAFLTGERFRGWRGSLFTGALAGRMLVRLSLDGDRVTGEERLLQTLNQRIRDVREGPDGALYLLTDHDPGSLLRLSPARP